MNRSNRYGKPFYSAIDYMKQSYSSKGGRLKMYHHLPSKIEIMQNAKNLRSWGLKIDAKQDIVFGKNGVLMFVIPSSCTTFEEACNRYPELKELEELGYKVKVAPCFYEMGLQRGLAEEGFETRSVGNKFDKRFNQPNKYGIFCKNYKDFFVPEEEIKYTDNSLLFIADDEKRFEIYNQLHPTQKKR